MSHCVKSYGHLCQIYQTTHQIWSCHVTLASNSENSYFSLNSVLNFRKVTKFGGNWLKNKKVTGKKNWGMENVPPRAYRVNASFIFASRPSKPVSSPAYCSILVLCFDGELSLVMKMYYFNIRHTMIVMIFYLFVSFNILTHDSSGIKNKEGGLYF